jgi:hypothetical protein
MKTNNLTGINGQSDYDRIRTFAKHPCSAASLRLSPRASGLRMALALAVVGLVIVGNDLGQAQSSKLNTGSVMSEATRTSDQDGKMTCVVWLPHEVLESGIQKNTEISGRQRQAATKLIEQYLVLGVCRYEMGPYAGFNFESEKDIRDHLVLVDGTGKAHRPIEEDAVSPDFQNVLSMLKPVMVNTLGKMGKSFYFFVFSAKGENGQVLGRASAEGQFSVQVADTKISWRLPLASLVPEKTCPTCGEKLSGAFKFCPYDAAPLGQFAAR